MKIANDLNIFAMVKSIKLLKVALKNSILTSKVKYESILSQKCSIDLDSNDEDSYDSFSIESNSFN